MDTYGEENERRIKYTTILPMGGDEATSPKNMEALYASMRSWGTEEYEFWNYAWRRSRGRGLGFQTMMGTGMY